METWLISCVPFGNICFENRKVKPENTRTYLPLLFPNLDHRRSLRCWWPHCEPLTATLHVGSEIPAALYSFPSYMLWTLMSHVGQVRAKQSDECACGEGRRWRGDMVGGLIKASGVTGRGGEVEWVTVGWCNIEWWIILYCGCFVFRHRFLTHTFFSIRDDDNAGDEMNDR